MAFRLVHRPVPRLVVVSCFVVASRFSSRLSSRVGVPFMSRGLMFSCWRFACRVGVGVSLLVLLLVSCRCLVLLDVSCRRYPVAPFLSARFPVSSRLVLSLLLFFACSSRRACRMASGRCGVTAERFVIIVVRAATVEMEICGACRYAMRCGMAAGGSVMPFRVSGRAVSGTSSETYGETRGRDDERAVFVSSI